MPNIKSAKKRVSVIETKTAQNRMIKTGVKTQIKKFESAVASGEGAQAAFNSVVASVDKAVTKGVMHKNTAARRKSALARKLNAAQ